MFLDTDIILNNLSEHIKAINGFHPHPIAISQQGSTQFINGDELEEDGIISPRSEYKPRSLISVCLIGQYIVLPSRVNFKEMVPISQSMFLCSSRRELYS